MIRKAAQWSFLLLVISLPLVRPFNFDFRGLTLPYTDLIFLLTAALAALAIHRGEIKLVWDRLYVFLAIYALTFAVSALLPDGSFSKLIGEYYLIALCILTFTLAREAHFSKKIVIAWLVAASLTVMASAAGFVLFYLGYRAETDNYLLSHFGSLPAGNYPRIHGLFANANMLCNYLNVAVIFALLAVRAGWVRRWMGAILVAGMLFAAAFSISPGLGGIVLSTGLWYWAMNRHRPFGWAALAIGVILATAMFAATVISPDTDNTTQVVQIPFVEKPFEPSVRVLAWENALSRAAEHPILGRGTGAYAVEIAYTPLSSEKQVLTDAHDMWLNIMGQTGIVGLVAFVLLVADLIRRSRFTIGLDRGNDRVIQIAFSCAFAGAFLYQGVTGSFEDARHLWVLIGLLAASCRNGLTVREDDISPASTVPSPRPST